METEINVEEKKNILLMTVGEFLVECGLNYNECLNVVHPSVEFLYGESYKGLRRGISFEKAVYVFDYIGIGKYLTIYKIACDKEMENWKKGISNINTRHYNMTGDQLEESLLFMDDLLQRYGLSINQGLSISDRDKLWNQRLLLDRENQELPRR